MMQGKTGLSSGCRALPYHPTTLHPSTHRERYILPSLLSSFTYPYPSPPMLHPTPSLPFSLHLLFSTDLLSYPPLSILRQPFYSLGPSHFSSFRRYILSLSLSLSPDPEVPQQLTVLSDHRCLHARLPGDSVSQQRSR